LRTPALLISTYLIAGLCLCKVQQTPPHSVGFTKDIQYCDGGAEEEYISLITFLQVSTALGLL